MGDKDSHITRSFNLIRSVIKHYDVQGFEVFATEFPSCLGRSMYSVSERGGRIVGTPAWYFVSSGLKSGSGGRLFGSYSLFRTISPDKCHDEEECLLR